MAGLGQYIKDTRGELHHVAWPTRTQTIVYTVLVVAVSLFTALYLGLFDYLFTGTVKRVVDATGGNAPAVIVQTASGTPSAITITTPTPTTVPTFSTQIPVNQ